MKRSVVSPILKGRLVGFLALLILSAVLSSGSPCHAVVLPFTEVTLSPDPASNPVPDIFDNTTVLTSYSTTEGTVSDLSHAIFSNGKFDLGGGGVLNSWGSAGVQIDGPQSFLNLDISTGVVNGGDTNDTSFVDVGNTGGVSMNAFFSQDINSGLAGDGNDFFIFENGANDTVDIVPLDASGNPIGDFTLTILDTDWGPITPGYSRLIENTAAAVTAVGGVAFDLEDFIGTGTLTGVRGIAISGTTGLDALIIGVNDALAPAPKPTLTVNRFTGAVTLDNPGSVALDFIGYSITSGVGSFLPANWKSIAANYDGDNDKSVDLNNMWTELTGADTHSDLSEFSFGGDGGAIGAGVSVVLSEGDGAWIPNPTEDLLGEVVMPDGSKLPVTIVFEGNGGVRLIRSDLNHDGSITANDWVILRDNTLEDFSDLSLAEQYSLGDITGNGVNDIDDFILFVTDFEAANGAGSFAAMLRSVPEPSSLLLIGLGSLLLCSLREQMVRRFAGLILLVAASIFWTSEARAVVIASDNFESYTPVVGDPDPHFGGSGENGGIGWTSPWELGTTGVNEMYVRSDLLTGYRQGLEITNLGNPSDNNIITRQFPTQTDDFYVGLTMRTTIDLVGIDDHHLFYLSDSTGADYEIGYGGGTRRGADVAGVFFTRQGNNQSDTNSSITQVYGQTYDMVLKFTKSGTATDPFDGIEMWIDQATEGAPDTTSNMGTAALSDLSTFHIWFDPRHSNPDNRGHLAFDNLVVASTFDEARSLIDAPPYVQFKTVVHPVTGEVAILNPKTEPIEFSAYQVTSVGADTLNPAGWNSLSEQNLDPVGGGDDLGETWDEAGTPSATSLAEQFLLGGTTLGPGESVSLGTIYDVGAGGVFELKLHEVPYLNAWPTDVEFALLGDMDGNGSIEEADVSLFVQALTDRAAFDLAQPNVIADLVGDFNGNGMLDLGDIQGFKAAVSGGSAASSGAVPEPATGALALLTVIGLLGFRAGRFILGGSTRLS